MFVDDLLHPPRRRGPIRLAIVEHHYRYPWEWDDELMPRNDARLASWIASVDGATDPGVLDDVRARLDDDLDTPGAFAVIDEAVAAGTSVEDAASLLGVELRG